MTSPTRLATPDDWTVRPPPSWNQISPAVAATVPVPMTSDPPVPMITSAADSNPPLVIVSRPLPTPVGLPESGRLWPISAASMPWIADPAPSMSAVALIDPLSVPNVNPLPNPAGAPGSVPPLSVTVTTLPDTT